MREKPELFLDNLRWVRSDPKYGDLGIVKFIMSLRNLEELGIRFTLDGSKIDIDSIKKLSQVEKHEYLA